MRANPRNDVRQAIPWRGMALALSQSMETTTNGATLCKVGSMWHLTWASYGIGQRVTVSFKTKTRALAHARSHMSAIGPVTYL